MRLGHFKYLIGLIVFAFFSILLFIYLLKALCLVVSNVWPQVLASLFWFQSGDFCPIQHLHLIDNEEHY